MPFYDFKESYTAIIFYSKSTLFLKLTFSDFKKKVSVLLSEIMNLRNGVTKQFFEI